MNQKKQERKSNGYDYSFFRDIIVELDEDDKLDFAYYSIDVISAYMECMKLEEEFEYMTDIEIKEVVKRYISNDPLELRGMLSYDIKTKEEEHHAKWLLGQVIFGWAYENGYKLKGTNLLTKEVWEQFELR